MATAYQSIEKGIEETLALDIIDAPHSPQDIENIKKIRDYIPAFITAIACDNYGLISAETHTKDNCIDIVYRNRFDTQEIDYRNTLQASSPDIRTGIQAMAPEIRNVKDINSGDVVGILRLKFPEAMGMTSDKLGEWLRDSFSEIRSDIKLTVNDDTIRTIKHPSLPVGTYHPCGNDQKCLVVPIEENMNILYDKGIPLIQKETPPGKGHLIFIEETNRQGLIIEPDNYPILNNQRLLDTLDNLRYKIPGSGDVNVNFDTLSYSDNLKKFGLSSLKDVTPEFIQGLSPEDLATFSKKCLQEKLDYETPDIYVRDTFSMVQYKQDLSGGVDTRRTKLTPQLLSLVDTWSDACRKSIKASGLSDYVRIGIMDTDTNAPPYHMTSSEMQEDGVPLMLIDANKASTMSSQEMLAEAVYETARLKNRLDGQKGLSPDTGRTIIEIFKKIPENDYLKNREVIRKNMGGCLVALPISDAESTSERLSTSFLKWAWPEITETHEIPEIPGSIVAEVEPSIGIELEQALSLFEDMPLDEPTPEEQTPEEKEHIDSDLLLGLFSGEPVESERPNNTGANPTPGF